MTPEQKIKMLEKRNLKNGDKVRFNVENQSTYFGPTNGVLSIENDDPHIIGEHNGKLIRIDINEYLSAYINTIEKTNE